MVGRLPHQRKPALAEESCGRQEAFGILAVQSFLADSGTIEVNLEILHSWPTHWSIPPDHPHPPPFFPGNLLRRNESKPKKTIQTRGVLKCQVKHWAVIKTLLFRMCSENSWIWSYGEPWSRSQHSVKTPTLRVKGVMSKNPNLWEIQSRVDSNRSRSRCADIKLI